MGEFLLFEIALFGSFLGLLALLVYMLLNNTTFVDRFIAALRPKESEEPKADDPPAEENK